MARPTNRPRSAFGERLLRARRRAGMTQQDLATRLGVTQALIRYYERDAVNPKADFVIKCAAALEVSPKALLSDLIAARGRRDRRTEKWGALLDRARGSLSPRSFRLFVRMVENQLVLMEGARRAKKQSRENP